MTSTPLISRLFLALALAGLLGCKQEEGDTCKEDDDCSGALVCCMSGEERGTCLPVGETCVDPDPDPIDLGPIEDDDLGTGDDMGAEMDLGSAEEDMGAETDLGSPEEDMGPESDLGTEEDMGAESDLGTEDMG